MSSNIPGPDDRTVLHPVDEGQAPRLKYPPPYLVIVDGPRTGARFPLSEGSNVIGRAHDNAIRLEDQSVSRQHADISKGPSGWVIKDLGSKNGTIVNGAPITDAVVIGHKDVIKAGIYQLRLVTQPTSLEEEMTLPPELASLDRTVFVAAPPDSLTAQMEKMEMPPEEPPLDSQGDEIPIQELDEEPQERWFKRRKFIIILGSLGLVAVGASAYVANRVLFKPQKTPPPKEEAIEQQPPPVAPNGTELPPPVGTPPPTPPTQPTPPEPLVVQTPPVQMVPLFLDFAASPMPAKVTFQERELGQTPIRVNVELELGKSYQAKALFEMPEMGQQYTQEAGFTVETGKAMIPILFKGPIGMLKVSDLPRDVQFYLEGKFSYDKFQEQTAKLREIVLNKPIYIPFGSYFLDLRRSKQLGETSATFVEDIIFRREFVIAEDSPTYILEVKDEDLKVFPAKIKSNPPNADVFVDGKPVGKTPFDGIFPLGEHKLTLRKEGFFEHAEDLKVDINTPYFAEITLKTSPAGVHINNARAAMNRAMYQDAINELAEALNSTPAPSEVALANYLLGECYLRLNDIQRAISYFQLARENETQRYPAMLGLANSYAIMQQMNETLPLLVEVLLKAQDEETKRAAHDLFQKISPFRSVMYIYSDPPGAQVVVNDKPLSQQTPLILHELSLGNYRIRIEKPGYLPTDLNLSLSVNEFNPVIVKLKPIPQ